MNYDLGKRLKYVVQREHRGKYQMRKIQRHLTIKNLIMFYRISGSICKKRVERKIKTIQTEKFVNFIRTCIFRHFPYARPQIWYLFRFRPSKILSEVSAFKRHHQINLSSRWASLERKKN